MTYIISTGLLATLIVFMIVSKGGGTLLKRGVPTVVFGFWTMYLLTIADVSLSICVLSLLITIISAIIEFSYWRVNSLGKKNELMDNFGTVVVKDNNAISFDGREGKVLFKVSGDCYLGVFSDTKEQVLLYIDGDVEKNDTFTITGIDGTHIKGVIVNNKKIKTQ